MIEFKLISENFLVISLSKKKRTGKEPRLKIYEKIRDTWGEPHSLPTPHALDRRATNEPCDPTSPRHLRTIHPLPHGPHVCHAILFILPLHPCHFSKYFARAGIVVSHPCFSLFSMASCKILW